jgi:hypothetical protein
MSSSSSDNTMSDGNTDPLQKFKEEFLKLYIYVFIYRLKFKDVGYIPNYDYVNKNDDNTKTIDNFNNLFIHLFYEYKTILQKERSPSDATKINNFLNQVLIINTPYNIELNGFFTLKSIKDFLNGTTITFNEKDIICDERGCKIGTANIGVKSLTTLGEYKEDNINITETSTKNHKYNPSTNQYNWTGVGNQGIGPSIYHMIVNQETTMTDIKQEPNNEANEILITTTEATMADIKQEPNNEANEILITTTKATMADIPQEPVNETKLNINATIYDFINEFFKLYIGILLVRGIPVTNTEINKNWAINIRSINDFDTINKFNQLFIKLFIKYKDVIRQYAGTKPNNIKNCDTSISLKNSLDRFLCMLFFYTPYSSNPANISFKIIKLLFLLKKEVDDTKPHKRSRDDDNSGDNRTASTKKQKQYEKTGGYTAIPLNISVDINGNNVNIKYYIDEKNKEHLIFEGGNGISNDELGSKLIDEIISAIDNIRLATNIKYTNITSVTFNSNENKENWWGTPNSGSVGRYVYSLIYNDKQPSNIMTSTMTTTRMTDENEDEDDTSEATRIKNEDDDVSRVKTENIAIEEAINKLRTNISKLLLYYHKLAITKLQDNKIKGQWTLSNVEIFDTDKIDNFNKALLKIIDDFYNSYKDLDYDNMTKVQDDIKTLLYYETLLDGFNKYTGFFAIAKDTWIDDTGLAVNKTTNFKNYFGIDNDIKDDNYTLPSINDTDKIFGNNTYNSIKKRIPTNNQTGIIKINGTAEPNKTYIYHLFVEKLKEKEPKVIVNTSKDTTKIRQKKAEEINKLALDGEFEYTKLFKQEDKKNKYKDDDLFRTLAIADSVHDLNTQQVSIGDTIKLIYGNNYQINGHIETYFNEDRFVDFITNKYNCNNDEDLDKHRYKNLSIDDNSIILANNPYLKSRFEKKQETKINLIVRGRGRDNKYIDIDRNKDVKDKIEEIKSTFIDIYGTDKIKKIGNLIDMSVVNFEMIFYNTSGTSNNTYFQINEETSKWDMANKQLNNKQKEYCRCMRDIKYDTDICELTDASKSTYKEIYNDLNKFIDEKNIDYRNKYIIKGGVRRVVKTPTDKQFDYNLLSYNLLNKNNKNKLKDYIEIDKRWNIYATTKEVLDYTPYKLKNNKNFNYIKTNFQLIKVPTLSSVDMYITSDNNTTNNDSDNCNSYVFFVRNERVVIFRINITRRTGSGWLEFNIGYIGKILRNILINNNNIIYGEIAYFLYLLGYNIETINEIDKEYIQNIQILEDFNNYERIKQLIKIEEDKITKDSTEEDKKQLIAEKTKLNQAKCSYKYFNNLFEDEYKTYVQYKTHFNNYKKILIDQFKVPKKSKLIKNDDDNDAKMNDSNDNNNNLIELIEDTLPNDNILYCKTKGAPIYVPIIKIAKNDIDDLLKLLFDIKRSGDWSQIHSVYNYNYILTDEDRKSSGIDKMVFTTSDRLASLYSKILDIPNIFVKKEAKEDTDDDDKTEGTGGNHSITFYKPIIDDEVKVVKNEIITGIQRTIEGTIKRKRTAIGTTTTSTTKGTYVREFRQPSNSLLCGIYALNNLLGELDFTSNLYISTDLEQDITHIKYDNEKKRFQYHYKYRDGNMKINLVAIGLNAALYDKANLIKVNINNTDNTGTITFTPENNSSEISIQLVSTTKDKYEIKEGQDLSILYEYLNYNGIMDLRKENDNKMKGNFDNEVILYALFYINNIIHNQSNTNNTNFIVSNLSIIDINKDNDRDVLRNFIYENDTDDKVLGYVILLKNNISSYSGHWISVKKYNFYDENNKGNYKVLNSLYNEGQDMNYDDFLKYIIDSNHNTIIIYKLEKVTNKSDTSKLKIENISNIDITEVERSKYIDYLKNKDKVFDGVYQPVEHKQTITIDEDEYTNNKETKNKDTMNDNNDINEETETKNIYNLIDILSKILFADSFSDPIKDMLLRNLFSLKDTIKSVYNESLLNTTTESHYTYKNALASADKLINLFKKDINNKLELINEIVNDNYNDNKNITDNIIELNRLIDEFKKNILVRIKNNIIFSNNTQNGQINKNQYRYSKGGSNSNSVTVYLYEELYYVIDRMNINDITYIIYNNCNELVDFYIQYLDYVNTDNIYNVYETLLLLLELKDDILSSIANKDPNMAYKLKDVCSCLSLHNDSFVLTLDKVSVKLEETNIIYSPVVDEIPVLTDIKEYSKIYIPSIHTIANQIIQLYKQQQQQQQHFDDFIKDPTIVLPEIPINSKDDLKNVLVNEFKLKYNLKYIFPGIDDQIKNASNRIYPQQKQQQKQINMEQKYILPELSVSAGGSASQFYIEYFMTNPHKMKKEDKKNIRNILKEEQFEDNLADFIKSHLKL